MLLGDAEQVLLFPYHAFTLISVFYKQSQFIGKDEGGNKWNKLVFNDVVTVNLFPTLDKMLSEAWTAYLSFLMYQ